MAKHEFQCPAGKKCPQEYLGELIIGQSCEGPLPAGSGVGEICGRKHKEFEAASPGDQTVWDNANKIVRDLKRGR
jgi:hypothetical protein